MSGLPVFSTPASTNADKPVMLIKPPLLSAKSREKDEVMGLAEFEKFDGVHIAASQLDKDLAEDHVATPAVDSAPNANKKVELLTGRDLRDDDSNLPVTLLDIPPLPEPVYGVEHVVVPSQPEDQHQHQHQQHPEPNTASPPKLYHPKPQRLVSSNLSEATDVFQNSFSQSEEPITTRIMTYSQVLVPEPEPVSEPEHKPEPDNAPEHEPDTTPKHSRPKDQQYVEEAGYDSTYFAARNSYMHSQSHSMTMQGQPTRNSYYPAPIPVALIIPPLLSKKGQKHHSQAGGHSFEPVRQRPRQRSRGKSLSKALENPPTWYVGDQSVHSNSSMDFIGDIGLQTEPSRPGSPALSIDSDQATFEDENDYQERKAVLSNAAPEPKPVKKSKVKSIFGWKSKANEENDGSEEFPQKEYTQPEHFEQGDSEANLYAQGGIIASTGGKPMSLLEELELRKAAKNSKVASAYTKLTSGDAIVAENRMSVYNSGNSGTSGNYVHPLDTALKLDKDMSLLQLQQHHEAMYKENSQLLNVARHQKYGRTEYKEDHATETLKERRERLKKEKQEDRARQDELGNMTLKERRQWLKTKKEKEAQAAGGHTSSSPVTATNSISAGGSTVSANSIQV